MRTLAAQGWLTIVSWVWRCLFWTGVMLAILYLVGARLTLDGRPDAPKAKPKATPTAVAATPTPTRPAARTAAEPQRHRPDAFDLLLITVVVGGGLLVLGLRLGPRLQQNREERAEFNAWRKNRPKAPAPAPAPAPRPWVSSGGQIAVADPPKTQPDTTTNGAAPHSD